MRKSQVNWPQEQMQADIANSGAPDAAESIITPGSSLYPPKNPGAATLDLVTRAAEVIGNIDNYAAQKQARAEALVVQAIGKIKIAEDRVRSAELVRRAAQADIQEFKETTEKAFSDRIEELKHATELAASRMSNAEAKLSAAEQRTKKAEMRAIEAEKALKRIEEMVRTRILPRLPSDFGGKAPRAA
jgi:hypothetical protein